MLVVSCNGWRKSLVEMMDSRYRMKAGRNSSSFMGESMAKVAPSKNFTAPLKYSSVVGSFVGVSGDPFDPALSCLSFSS